ncbi:MAG TPA: hypothetical protein VNM14_17105 [Planctomycetota bacterium]|nr:hypothetical protein [Planctomycetota bacterium]
MEISFDEKFALAQDRKQALQQLIPGTEDYYYYHCLVHEQEGQKDDVRKLLETWVKRHGWTSRAIELSNRQALIHLEADPKTSFEYVRRQLNLTFQHQREVEGQATHYPTRLDPSAVARDAWKQQAFSYGGSTDLSGFADPALDWLAAEKLGADRRRALLERLTRPDFPNLVDLVQADLKHKDSSGFGSMEIHRHMTGDQLLELGRRESKLYKEDAFVTACLLQRQPGPDSDWENDPKEKQAYLERLWDLVEPLAAAFNRIKAHVLYHRLDLDRSLGVYDRKRFLRYLEIPREASYVNPKWLDRCRKDAELRDAIFSLGEQVEGIPLFPAVGNDEPLVADYLDHFFADAKDFKPFDEVLLDTWLKVRFAETKILNGQGDMEKWYSLLNDPGHYQQLKDRVQISFPPHNRSVFRAGDPVRLDVDIKNVESLQVKVFEINTLNYYSGRGQEVDTSIDLDGLVAAEEKTYAYKEPPLRRVRRSFEFPSLKRAGIFVIEFIGGGISSRALIRKGRLRFLERVGAAGHVFTVLDEDARPLKDASIWLGGREYVAEKDGTIAVPFSAQPARETILLRHGEQTSLDAFDHRAETYQFTAGLFVDRESLIRRNEAQLLLRPSLRIHDAPASLTLIEDASLQVRSTDRFGVESTMEIRGLELHEDRETVVPFQVPEDLVSITFTVRGRVENLAQGKKIDVSDSRSFTLNEIERTEKTEDLHLARTEKGFVLYVLGKTGEVRPDTPVTLAFAHNHFTFEMNFTLQTDAKGRIELGPLEEITGIRASTPSAVTESWTPGRPESLVPAALHAAAGESLRVPFMGETLRRDAVALLERIDEGYRKDCFDALDVRDGFLVLRDLPAGDYELHLKEAGAVVEVKIASGVRANGWAVSRRRMLQESELRPLQISKVKAGKDELRISVENAGPATRVHVVGTRYLPGHSIFAELGREGLPSPWEVQISTGRSAYVSGRDLGDEYRYILERQQSKKFPGNTLTRPGLLLNPWAVRSTETGLAAAAAGGEYDAVGAASASAPAQRAAAPEPVPASAGAFSSVDFLSHPAAVIANLKPGPDGTVAVPREALARANQVRIIAVDPSGTVTRNHYLPEVTAEPRDLRLRLGLDPLGHFTEKKEVALLESGQKLEIADLTATKLETYDTLARVFGLYRTLSGLATLDAFEFLVRWPNLSDEEKRSKYGEFACHELHFFLSRKDPEFFRKVVQPYLRNKKDKTFMDRYLLEEDLSSYRRPWEFGRLNALERILLARRIDDEHDPVARHSSDRCDLLPIDLLRDGVLFDTALKGKSLEAGDDLGLQAATVAAQKMAEMDRDASGQSVTRMMAPKSMAAPAPIAADMSMSEGAMESEAPADAERDDEYREEPKAKRSAKKLAKERSRGPGAGGAGFGKADLRRRQAQRQLYRTLDQTMEWAENNYYKLPILEQGPELIPINRFWRDFAKHDVRSPFVSVHLAEASRNLTEILCALAVLDLPFESARPDVAYAGLKMTLKPKGRTAVFLRQIKAAEPLADRVPILVSQNFLRHDDRFRHEGPERFDKYVADEFLVHVVYVAQVVLTNPTSSPHKLDLLLQIPMGALPALNGFYSRSVPVTLGAYATQQFEYAFYFPAAGTYEHFPVHVSKNERMIAAAPPVRLKAVDRLSRVDQTSWEYLSQHGDAKTVLRFLEESNIDRLNLEKIAWRMSDDEFFDAALSLLSRRHVYHNTLWSYGVQHKDVRRTRDYLLHQEHWLRGCGMRLDGTALPIDPVALRWVEHLEYAPLVNARAHRLGASRRILNQRFAEQYARLLSTLRYRARLTDDDLLAVAYYLFLQDRIEEGLAMLDRVDRDRTASKLQLDYLQVYAEFYREKPRAARAIAEKHRDHPVDRWRKLFRNALAQLDEVDGDAAAVADPEDRDQRQGKLAATESAFELAVEGRTVTIRFQNLAKARVNYYRMDIELLFSRQPFVQEQSDRFGFIMPNKSVELALTRKDGVQSFELPSEFHGANVVVELEAAGRRVSKPCFAHELSVQVVESYGQLRVAQRSTRKPLPRAYVKAYARSQDGGVKFFKDGYTDLRGRFDYSSLSTSDLDGVERFALLVLSDEHGAVIQEAAPPKR